ncbi:hypothetical protein [Pseudomonas sichuanensis]|uniref:Uncharacterized protein n=1 Tax=Pseudomonas sichuanensis TaxID=2213015 RepID=A0ABV0DH36_9PSED
MSPNVADVGKIPCVVVFTNRGRNRLWLEGGSQSWRIDASRASKYEYVVCVQNRNESWGEPSAPHKNAFLIGKIDRIVPSKECPDRQKIEFSRSAEISVPDMWDGNRNPVAYMTLGDFGIRTPQDFDNLRFTSVVTSLAISDEILPGASGDEYQAAEGAAETNDLRGGTVDTARALSIEEAKRGLARRFGVSESQIEIVIRA